MLLTPCVAGAQMVVTTNRPLPDSASSASSTAASRSWKAVPAPEHKLAVETASGFGLFATVKDRSVDAATPDRLVEGPNGSLFDESAGLGWRRNNVSAMVGYMHPSTERPLYEDENISYHRPRGRFGIGLSLHY